MLSEKGVRWLLFLLVLLVAINLWFELVEIKKSIHAFLFEGRNRLF